MNCKTQALPIPWNWAGLLRNNYTLEIDVNNPGLGTRSCFMKYKFGLGVQRSLTMLETS